MESTSINHVTKQCKTCQQVKPIDQFYKYCKSEKRKLHCKSCDFQRIKTNFQVRMANKQGSKQCIGCKEKKAFTEFNPNTKAADKMTSLCSACISHGNSWKKPTTTLEARPATLNHMTELRKRLSAVSKLIAKKEEAMANPKRITDEFMEEYKKLNLLRIEKATIESRIRTKELNPQSLAILPVSISNL